MIPLTLWDIGRGKPVHARGLPPPTRRTQPLGLGLPESALPTHLHLTCYPLLTTLSPCPLSARTRITKPPQDQSVIKGTQASMVCGVTHDPRVTVRYSLCCDPMEAKGEGSL